jgi:hypothetical protein
LREPVNTGERRNKASLGAETNMLASDQVEELICVLSTWDRQTLISQFHQFHSAFPIDLTPDYMERLPLEKLRHVFLAMCLQNKRLPDLEYAA